MIVKERIQRADGSIHYREYLKQQKLGKGGFAQCFVAERTCDRKKYALKIISKKLLEKPKPRQKMLSEIKLHRQAKHKNICELEKAFEDDQYVYMLLQLCSNGNMFEMIRRRKRLTIPETQFFILQLIDALCYLHNREMIHRDVKLGNLLIDEKMNLKLADFGLTTKLEFKGDLKHTVCGTPNYIAPEIIKSGLGLGASGHSYEVDVWSTGVIMYLMLIGKAPFQTAAVQKTYQRISKGQFDFPQWFKDTDAKDLIRNILVVDPVKRFTFEQVVNHPFMCPKCGIPKELPSLCLTQAPKFGVFEKYEQEPVKKSARDASIITLRSSVDLSMDQDFEGLDYSKHSQVDPETKKGAKNIKGLSRSVFSTSSLSKSLQKLSELSRTSSPQPKSVRNLQQGRLGNNQSRMSVHSNKIINTSLNNSVMMKGGRTTQEIQQINLQMKKKQIAISYIVNYKHQTVWNYLLSNGYIGTYQPNYKLLYNRHNNIYLEIQNESIKLLKKSDEITNQKLNNRKKFIKNYQSSTLQCQPFITIQRLIYLIKIYKVQSSKIILFRLSNGIIQAHDYNKNIYLIITDNWIIMIQMDNGKQINKVVQMVNNYSKCPVKMVQLYLQVKRIINNINKKKCN